MKLTSGWPRWRHRLPRSIVGSARPGRRLAAYAHVVRLREALVLLQLTAQNLAWLPGVPPEEDLCAHGGFSLSLDDATLIEAPNQSFALSAAALHLLRSVDRDHATGGDPGEQLVPCCGHAIWVVDGQSEVRNFGCGLGLDWSITHGDGVVTLALEGGRTVRVLRAEWARAVLAFAATVEAFYAASAPKRLPDDALDREGYEAFWAEWRRRREAVERAA